MVIYGFPARKYHIKKEAGWDIEELFDKFGFKYDAGGKEGWTGYKEAGRYDLLAGRVFVQDQGSQIMVIASKSSALKSKLKELAYFDELYYY